MVKFFLTVVFVGIIAQVILGLFIANAKVTAAKVGLYG